MRSREQLQQELDSLEQLHAIVSAMKALSAASIRQYEQAVAAVASYHRTVELGLHVVLRDLAREPVPARNPHERRRLAAIVFGSDHGLCGRFNEEIAQYATDRMASAASADDEWLVLAVGARVAASMEQAGHSIDDRLLVPGSAAQITVAVQQILLIVDAWRQRATGYQVYLFYNRHSDSTASRPIGFQLLPVDFHRFRRLQAEPWPGRSLPTFTMAGEALLGRLLRQYLFVSIFRAAAESLASEHASRLAAMEAAERHLDDRVEETTMSYRRARQEAITAEVLDIIGGFEAITGGHAGPAASEPSGRA